MSTTANGPHLSEEDALTYSTGEATAYELPRWEEHLLICESCRGAVTGCDAYVAAMRSAAAKLRREPAKRPYWRLYPGLVPVAVALALLAVCAVVFLRNTGRAPAPFAVSLATTRGPGSGGPAPAGTPLLLRPDLTGLPALPSYSLQVVDSAGAPVWQGVVAASVAARGVSIPPLQPGAYFARISAPQGELYREYGLEIRSAR